MWNRCETKEQNITEVWTAQLWVGLREASIEKKGEQGHSIQAEERHVQGHQGG